jgi:type IX secretion system PorP/SprF family membrane protein
MIKGYWIFLILLFLALHVKSQDIHWSQFNDNPLFQNPGNAGNFNGDFRFVGNYRDQWRSVTVPYSTLSFSTDTRLKKQSRIGLGIQFFNDNVGDGKFQTMEFQVSGSYKINLTSDSAHIIRPGITLGFNHRQVNWNKFSFDNQFDGVVYDPSLPTNETFQNQQMFNLSVGAGIIYQTNILKEFPISTGISLFNINRPNQSFYGAENLRDMRANIFAKGSYSLDMDWDLLPSINLNMQGKYREFILGSAVKYTLINKLGTYRAVYMGAWFRNRDAAYLTAGMDYQNWFFGISYDINVSKLVAASNGRGGLEVAIRYIWNIFKPSKNAHRICPDFI